MEVKEGERVVIAKPVASRPSCSSFRTFTELLNTSVMVSPESIRHEISLDAAIRPKTVRFRAPGNNGVTSTLQSPQGKGNDINKACEETENKNYVVYKPKAKLVSKATVSVLANMLQGNSQQPWKQQSQTGKNVRQNGRSLTEQESTSSMDGYNWRKYGQKQVKGSECPRSYYKCTHPNCPVKKKVERSIDGQISEIVYQGEHNHSKPPCPLPRRASGKLPPVITTSHQGTRRQEANVYYPTWNEPFEFAVPRSANSDSACKSSQCDEGSNVEVDDLSKSKKRRNEKQSSDGGGGGSETQGSMDSESLEDGFRWRKYGQKVVGGNAYPRSYYRCTSANCRARKHVERASDDPRAFITTYEGKHNHHFLHTPPSSTTTSTLPHHSNK